MYGDYRTDVTVSESSRLELFIRVFKIVTCM